MSTPALINIVDDDRLIGLAFAGLLRSAGYRARSFTSPRAFLAAFDPEVPGCVVTDLVMPEMNGIELQGVLKTLDDCPPIIFFSGKGDVKTTAEAMKSGAVDFSLQTSATRGLFNCRARGGCERRRTAGQP
jgi:FixJ family two-component response regulator